MDSTSPFVIHNRCSFDAFVFLWIVCARNMFNFRQSSRRSQGSHPWLTFPRISSDSTMRRWRKKPDKLKKKEIYVPDALDWEWLGGARYEEELAPYLVKKFNHNGVFLTCDGWNRLFRIQEPVYQELCWEYFSTVSFRGGNDYYNPGNIKFCLGGEYCQCSMVELSWRLGIYDQQLVNTPEFGTFLEHCHQFFLDGVRGDLWWSTIAKKMYIAKSAQEGSIQSPTHRLIHRVISSTINQRKDDDKVPTLDVFYLWSINTPNTFFCIPYCIAVYLTEGVVKDRKTSKINGWMFMLD